MNYGCVSHRPDFDGTCSSCVTWVLDMLDSLSKERDELQVKVEQKSQYIAEHKDLIQRMLAASGVDYVDDDEQAVCAVEALRVENEQLKRDVADFRPSKDRTLAVNERLRVQVKKLLEALHEAEELLLLCDPENTCAVIRTPEDPEVRDLCERVGYGAVMDSASRQWREKSPEGAHTSGPAVASVKRGLELIRSAHAAMEDTK